MNRLCRRLQLILVGWMLWTNNIIAQEQASPSLLLKTIPSTLFDVENSLTLAVEVPFSKHWSVQQELGWGDNAFNIYSRQRELYPNRETWRFRTQIRYYLTDKNTGAYLAMEYYHKNVVTHSLMGIGQGCNPATGACAYFQEMPIRTNRKVSAAHLKWGCVLETAQRVIIDVYMGMGIRGLVVTDNVGGASTFRSEWFTFRPNRPGNYGTTLGISAGIALGYAFRPRKPKSLSLP
ncbi:DUF3575 domain-containing protein [Runella sp. MFBS21]|uniref:DUF3575 domain-containing protein n=1 Tax=Runella sp. MFBS21 TaxID=3034018 RepID=UPI0023F88945|nr:DUF3575 domain-containing protein [Runella sp. MFBS21]MDF7822225.1 DUF3575 domain-containing protein [Runella sp. MFBS21]